MRPSEVGFSCLVVQVVLCDFDLVVQWPFLRFGLMSGMAMAPRERFSLILCSVCVKQVSIRLTTKVLFGLILATTCGPFHMHLLNGFFEASVSVFGFSIKQ